MMARRTTTTGFTLIEIMLAVLLMALLASAAALSFSGPLQRARSRDAVELLRSFDASGRFAARRYGKSITIVFDLAGNTVSRQEGKQDDTARAQVAWPGGYWADEVRIGRRSALDGDQVPVPISSMGLSPTYAVRLRGPEFDQWVIVAGLTGELTQVQDEPTTAWLLAKATGSAGASGE